MRSGIRLASKDLFVTKSVFSSATLEPHTTHVWNNHYNF